MKLQVHQYLWPFYRNWGRKRKDEKQQHGAVDKSSSEHNSFINRMRLPLLCEKSEIILLVLVGITAGQQYGRQSDEILVDLEIPY